MVHYSAFRKTEKLTQKAKSYIYIQFPDSYPLEIHLPKQMSCFLAMYLVYFMGVFIYARTRVCMCVCVCVEF